MTDQADPVSLNECVLRRIPADGNRFNPSLPEPVQRLAFEPTGKDIDGISVFRELFVSAQQVADAGSRGAIGNYVVRLRVADIVALGLTVIPNPRDDQLPGHALVPELRLGAMKADKKTSKEYQRALAKLAGSDIAYSPH